MKNFKILEKQRTLKKFVEHNFDWDVSELDGYTDEQSEQVFPELVERADTLQHLTIMESVKGSEKIKLISSDATTQVADDCGFNASGGTDLTDKTITVAPIKIQEQYCNEDLVGKWSQMVLRAGIQNQNEELPFQDVIMALMMKKMAKITEDLIWKGDDTSITPNLLHFDGFIKLLDADSDVIEANTTGVTSITSANGMTVLRTLASAIPVKVLDEGNVKIFCGIETYNAALDQLYAENKFHYMQDQDDARRFVIPGKSVEVIQVNGLNGTNKIYAMPLDYAFFGTDREGDMSDFRIWYSQDDDVIKISIKWRAGVQYVYSDNFVKFTLDAS